MSSDSNSQDKSVTTEAQKLIIVDARLPNYQALLDTIDGDAEVLVLRPELDGIQQLAEMLEGYQNLDALHIISHGNSAELILGTARVTQDNLSEYQEEFASIGQSLRKLRISLIQDSETSLPLPQRQKFSTFHPF